MGWLLTLGAMTGLSGPALGQDADSASILIYDASGSMWGQLDGGITKVEIAREVIGDFFISRDTKVPLGVIAYGHNRRGDCSDIEVIAKVDVNNPSELSARLNRLNPRGMTPITDSLSLAASMIPPTAESADIILVTDGLETCEADPCALAAQLAKEGIAIRAHVVGFGLTNEEAEAMACVADATGGLLLRPQTGQELADALNQIAQVEPAPNPVPESEPVVSEAFFDIGPRAEAGHSYSISYRGEALNSDFAGFTPRGEGKPPSSASFGPIGGGSHANNPFTKRAPVVPGEYDLILFKNNGEGIIARQPIEVVAASNGFEPIGSVEPGSRVQVAFRGPEQMGERLVLARPDQPVGDFRSLSWDFALHKNGVFRLKAPTEPGLYEVRYLNSSANEVMFSRQFGVGVPFEDTDQTNTADLAAQAAAATQAAPGQDVMPMIRATFRIPDTFPQIPLWWEAVPLDPDMNPEAWAPISEMVVGEGEFEPGRYRVSTTGPGEVEFRAEVEIYPGQNNDFIIPPVEESDDEASATQLTGPWQVIGVPPYQVQANADQLLTLALEQTRSGGSIRGSWTAKERLAGPQASGREGMFTTATLEDGALRLVFTVGAPIPEPMTLYVTPYKIGYAGTLSSGAMGMSIVMWPGGYQPPSLTEMREAVHGPAPSDFVDMSGTIAVPSKKPSDEVKTVSVRFLTPFEIGGKRVQWSAVRTDRPVSDTAFAMNDFEHMLIVDLEPGTYAVEGINEAEGIYLADTVTVIVGGENSFEIPKAGAGDRGEAKRDPDEDVALVCANAPQGCEVRHDASGISVTLPNNWTMSEPYFFETAGGARADLPTATFFSEESGEPVSLELNPRQWLASNGNCRPVGASQLCNYVGQGPTSDMAFEIIYASLSIVSINGSSIEGDSPLQDAPADTSSDPMAGTVSGLLEGALGMPRRGTEQDQPSTTPTNTIQLVLSSSTQFGSACFINARLSNPSGESFTLFAPIKATANGQPVRPVLNPDMPAMLEVTAYAESGAGLSPIALMAPCDELAVMLGPVQCRMGVGDGGPLTSCPMQVEAVATPEFADLAMINGKAAAMQPLPGAPDASTGASAALGDIIRVDLGGRDPAAVLQQLFGNQQRN